MPSTTATKVRTPKREPTNPRLYDAVVKAITPEIAAQLRAACDDAVNAVAAQQEKEAAA